ncbi:MULTISPECIES: Hsp20/alpha crystallin family protein [Flavobacteriaceae]|uniref:Hsp20/alpha crystallin family protein n=1 Tax=Flagellimonas alvinocaridis TaxID=2530200 RepID=A0A4S8RXY2_9FLAO|nr:MULTISPECIES: Hsp20/alpha crystallin family protein [Allomuricauda]MDC6362729.1 Hsp20/alpha crystallin family protein [Muricauda sp. SP22]THV60249.1 Hsp20/alpha crystallin family protein [Allomuricauda alvinocaridis]
MSIVKRNNLFFPALLNDVMGPDWFGGTDKWNTTVPAVNIKDNEKEFELELAVPGVKKEDFTVEVDHDVLTVSSEIKSESKDTKENYTRKEFSYSSFKRAFTLPETVDGSKIDAKYEDGVLKLTLPKKEEALPKPKRLISIG